VREPEPETIRRARDGDLSAFEDLVRAYQADAWRYAYHLTGRRGTADDVVQEAFLHAFRSMGTYHGEARFSNWLLRIVRNCAIDAYRRTRRETPVAFDRESGFAGVERGMSVAEPGEDRIRLAQAIRHLPIDLREAFVTIEVLGFDYRESSQILGVKVGTLKSRMHRARAHLIRALGQGEAADEM
jgi:RNA polymerase sigma-70 factor (ECF subfamily)